MDLTTIDLKVAFREQGCPVCRLRYAREDRCIYNTLYEHVNDPDTRSQLVRSLGFCPSHAWQMQQMEQANWHDGMGTAIIYEDITARARAGLRSYLNRPALEEIDPHRRKSRRRTRRGSGSEEGRARTEGLPRGLAPRERCRVCASGDEAESWLVETLVRACDQEEFRGWYRSSEGLCLPHLRQALAHAAYKAHADIERLLAETAVDRLDRLAYNLKEYVRKESYENRSEPKLETEQRAWIDGVAFFAGNLRMPVMAKKTADEARMPPSR